MLNELVKVKFDNVYLSLKYRHTILKHTQAPLKFSRTKYQANITINTEEKEDEYGVKRFFDSFLLLNNMPFVAIKR